MSRRFTLKSVFSLVIILLTAFVLVACDGENDQALVDSAIATLELPFAEGDTATTITQDLSVPVLLGDVSISWSSNNTAVISNAGVVTRPAAGQSNATVILTATLTIGEISGTKTFTVVVLAYPVILTDQQAVDAASDSLTVQLGSGDTLTAVTKNVTLATMSGTVNVSWSSSNTAVISNAGVVTRPLAGQPDVTVVLTATLTLNAITETKTFSLVVTALPYTDQQIVDQAVISLAIIYASGNTSSSVTQNVTLPPTVGTVAVSWSSSNTAVISNSGVITRPAEGQPSVTVLLTATLTKGTITGTQTFTLVVMPYVAVDVNDILVLINPMYTDGMTEDDFDDEWEYEDYRVALRLSTTYSDASATVGMSEDDALGFFSDFYEMTSNMDIDNMSALMTNLEMFENNNMTPAATAYILYELAQLGLEMQIESSEADIEYFSQDIASISNSIDALKADSDLIAAQAKFMSYTTEANQGLAEEFLAADNLDLFYLCWMVQDIAYDLFTYGYTEYEFWSEGDEYAMMLIDVITAAYDANDLAYLETLQIDGIIHLEILYQRTDSLAWRIESIERSEANIIQMNEALNVMEENEDVFIDSLEVVVNFLMTFKNSLPQNVITLFDSLITNGDLSMEEYFIIKDAVVDLLIDILPADTDFALLHRALFYFVGAIYEIDITSHLDQADFLGELDYAYLDLFLTLIADVDQQTLEDIIAIASEIQTEELVYDYYYEDFIYEYRTDYAKVMELAIYVLTSIDNFVTENQTKVDAVSALMDDEAMKDLFALAMEQVKAQIANESYMSEDEIALTIDMIDDLVADYDQIKAGLEVFEEIGVGLIDELMATEGIMFITLFELENVDDPELAVQTIEQLLVMFAEYNTIFVEGMTQADIQAVLRMIKVPLLFGIAQENPEGDYSATFDTLLPFVATIISNLLTIEQQILAVAQTMDLDALLFDPNYDDSNYGVLAALFKGADLVLTPSIELLIEDTITIVIDDILMHADLMELHGLSLIDLDDIKSLMIDSLSDIFDEIHVVAAYDFTILTEIQESRVLALMEMIRDLFMFGVTSEEPTF